MRVLWQFKVPRAEVMLLLSNVKTFARSKKEMNKAVTILPNGPMFAVRLWITISTYRWPIGSLPSPACSVLSPHSTKDVYTPQGSTRDLWTVGRYPEDQHWRLHHCEVLGSHKGISLTWQMKFAGPRCGQYIQYCRSVNLVSCHLCLCVSVPGIPYRYAAHFSVTKNSAVLRKYIILAYFPKMKVGLSNHQPVSLSLSLSVCVCVPLITFEPFGGFSWNLVGRWCHWRWPRRHIF
jgi:hypothetical protein